MADELKYKHFFVVEDGKMIFEDKEMFRAKMMMLLDLPSLSVSVNSAAKEGAII